MKASRTMLVAMAAGVTMTSVAAAGPAPSRQNVAISAKGVLNQGMLTPSGFGDFVLRPLQAGAPERDSGTVTSVWRNVVVRVGHRLETYDAVSTFLGRRGSLVILERVEWLDPADGSHSGLGTWKVVRGTGQYRRLAGDGRSGSVWLERAPWSSRYEGLLVRR